MYTSDFPINNVTVDAVVLTVPEKGDSLVLLVERGQEPYKGALALPGGFLDPDESAADCAVREVFEETGFNIAAGSYERSALTPMTAPERDPRSRVVSLPYVFWVPEDAVKPVMGADDAAEAMWVPVQRVWASEMAFDHKAILTDAWNRTALKFGGGDSE